MFSKLFHKDVYMPKSVAESAKNCQAHFSGYVLTQHLQEHLDAMDKNRSHNYLREALVKCLETIKDNPQEAFEVELSKDYHLFKKSGWFVTKYCIRIPYDDKQDIVVSIRPYYDAEKNKFISNKNRVITAWLNDNKDDHVTLDSSKYCSKQEWLKIK